MVGFRHQRTFSLTETLVALAILSLLCIPFARNIRQSENQAGKTGKKFMAVMLSRTVFEHLELYFSNPSLSLDLFFNSQPTVEKRYDCVETLLKDFQFSFSAMTRKYIVENYNRFSVQYTLWRDQTPGSRPYMRNFMKLLVTIIWEENGKPKKIDYTGEIIGR